MDCNLEDMRRFLEWVIDPFEESFFIEIYGYHYESGFPKSKLFKIDEQNQILRYAEKLNQDGYNVYITHNPVNGVNETGKAVQRPLESNCPNRTNLFVDIEPDSKKRNGLPSTEQEKQLAYLTARAIRDFLTDEEKFSTFLGDSGNGYQIGIRCNLPSDRLTKEKIKTFYRFLDTEYQVTGVNVDIAVATVVTGFRFLGTINRKKQETQERPWRVSKLLEINDGKVLTEDFINQYYDSSEIDEVEELPVIKSNYKISDIDVPELRKYFERSTKKRLDMLNGTTINRKVAIVQHASNIGRFWARCRYLAQHDLDCVFADTARIGSMLGSTSKDIADALKSARRYASEELGSIDFESLGLLKKKKVVVKGITEEQPNEILPSKTERSIYHMMARQFLDSKQVDGLDTYRYINSNFFRWNLGDWLEIDRERMEDEFTSFVCERVQKINKGDIGICCSVLRQTIVELGECRFERSNYQVYFKSNIYDIRDGQFHEYSPRTFNSYRLDCDYVADFPDPVLFNDFARSSLDNNESYFQLLLEYIGHIFFNDMTQQKMLYLKGPTGTGKSTLAHLIEDMFGQANIVNPTMEQLGEKFGSEQLIGKSLALVSETRTSVYTDIQSIVQKLLTVTGNDNQSIRRMRKTNWFGPLFCRFLFVMNDFPIMPDSSGALLRRILFLKFGKMMEEKDRDVDLYDKLKQELPGIVKICFEAELKRRLEKRKLEQPEGMINEMADLVVSTNITSLFINEVCLVNTTITDPEQQYVCYFHDLWGKYKNWCLENGHKSGSSSSFSRSIKNHPLTAKVEFDKLWEGSERGKVRLIGIRY